MNFDGGDSTFRVASDGKDDTVNTEAQSLNELELKPGRIRGCVLVQEVI